MIGKNWIKALAVAGATAAVAAAMPAISEARTHYTGKAPAGIAMMDITPVSAPVKKTAISHTTKKLSHKKGTTLTSKHKSHKVIKKLSVKKKTV